MKPAHLLVVRVTRKAVPCVADAQRVVGLAVQPPLLASRQRLACILDAAGGWGIPLALASEEQVV